VRRGADGERFDVSLLWVDQAQRPRVADRKKRKTLDERPRGCHPAEQRDDLAPFQMTKLHSVLPAGVQVTEFLSQRVAGVSWWRAQAFHLSQV
jgi:hypothetical protein